MAADGAWPKGSGPGADEPDDARTRRAVDQLRGLLSGLEGRLAAPGPAPLGPETTADLAEALDALARRMTRHEGAAAGRYEALVANLRVLAERLDVEAARQAALGAQVADSEARIQGRLHEVVAELAVVRATQAAAAEAPEPDPALLRLVLAAAAGCAALSVLGAGAMILAHPEALPKAVSAVLAPLGDLNPRPGLRPEPVAAPGPRATLPLPVKAIIPSPGLARERYEDVAAALERGEATALPRLTGLAQAGDSRAQIHLAGLYEAGAAGVPRDLAAARLWTRKAAEGGDRVAMHNLALFLAAGEGGVRDDAEAATWFRRAADRGVEKNLREAYRWFAVAANAGDAAAREKQVDLEARLTPAERSGLDRDVSGYQPGAPPPADRAAIIAPAETLAETQALLARKGYYVGPVDGVPSPAFRQAAAAYLRDHPEAKP